jgi:dTDP-4-amino-4,6-dideoxygalactose transaminase
MTIQQKANRKKGTTARNIPMVDLKAQYRALQHEIEAVIREILESGHFVLGKHVTALEKEVAQYHHVDYAASLASGTDALHLCLRAFGIKEGDEVITTPFTFVASAEAIAYIGAKPVFADIDRNTLNIDPLKLKEKINEKTRAIMPVHLFGLPADMDEIMDIAKEYNLKVIEDCAQAFGAHYRGRPVGSIGDAGCFSFYPSKNLGGYGDGGMMITSNPDIHETVRLLRNHGATGSYKHSFIGYNSRLDEIQAAILRIKLKHIDAYNNARRNLAQIYTSLIKEAGEAVQCPTEVTYSKHVYHQYTIRSSKRINIQEALQSNSASSVVYYPTPLHLQKAFRYLGYRENDFPESESASREALSLPMYPELEPGKAKFIAEIVVRAVG